MNSQPSFSWSRPNDTLLQSQTANNQSINRSNNPLSPGQAAAVHANVTDNLQKIKEAFDPTSPNCAFQYYFYNKVPVDQAMLYSKPPNQSQDKWDEAISKRPDASSIPVLAVGFSDLQKRAALQNNQVAAYRGRMHEINNKLDELGTRHDIYTTVKAAEIKNRHRKLIHRTLALAVKIQVLKSRGFVLRPDEELLKQTLENLNAQIDDPAVFGRINEVWARMGVLREKAKALEQTYKQSSKLMSASYDEEQLEKFSKILIEQQKGIAYMANVLGKDIEQVEQWIGDLEKRKRRI
jgi:nuclear pore complex protein Nup54